jgi:phosphatidate cytidylyltransferase
MTLTRVLTAVVLIPIVIGLVLLTPTWVVAIATAVITILALREFFALGDAIGHRAYRLWTIFCALLLIFECWCTSQSWVSGPAGSATLGAASHTVFPYSAYYRFAAFGFPGALFFLFVLGLAVLTLFTRRPLVESLPSAGISSGAFLLVAFPLSFAVRLHAIDSAINFLGPRLLLFSLVITWAADTTAYFVGRAIGKHPLALHISPKKTWEGSIGSIVGSLIVAYAFHYWLYIPIPHLLAMAMLGNIAGQMGDLLESACKRSAGVKDSGSLLPGHGGMLDRIDALILCIPVIWYYLVLVNPPIVP